MREQTSAAGHNPTTISLSTLMSSCRGEGWRRGRHGEGGTQKREREENDEKEERKRKEEGRRGTKWTDEERRREKREEEKKIQIWTKFNEA